MPLRSPIRIVAALLLASTVVLIGAHDAIATTVTFRYRASTSPARVNLAGTFNQWSTSATSMADVEGVWEVTIELAPGKHQYKYVVDGDQWITDEWAVEFSDDGFGGENSVVVVGDRAMIAGEGSREIRDGNPSTPEASRRTPVTFHYRPAARELNSVSVAGSFNDWDAAAHILRDDDRDGVWSVTVEVEAGDIAFQFVIDGDEWIDTDVGQGTDPDDFGGQRARATIGEEALELGP